MSVTQKSLSSIIQLSVAVCGLQFMPIMYLKLELASLLLVSKCKTKTYLSVGN